MGVSNGDCVARVRCSLNSDPDSTDICSLEQVAFLDGLLSYTWQAWCRFCRDLVVSSCLGARLKSGAALPVCVAPATPERISHIAVQVRNKRPSVAGRENNILRVEPTWGDVSLLTRIVSELKPGNELQLVAAFGGITRGPIHLQLVRNATAHLNQQTFNEVRQLGVFYLASPIRFPCESVFWIDANTTDSAFQTWIDDMTFVAASAV